MIRKSGDFVKKNELEQGLNNYKKITGFPYFSWPLWVSSRTNPESKNFSQITPPLLLNNTEVGGIEFSNYFSSENIIIDNSGMISNSFSTWSVEFSVISGGEIVRPHDSPENITLSRDVLTKLPAVHWTDKNFRLSLTFYGAKTSIDEVFVDIECTNTKGSRLVLLVNFRPYNNAFLGGIGSAGFIKDSSIVKINGGKFAFFSSRPDYIYTGSSRKGDIDISVTADSSDISCPEQMGAISAGYNILKGHSSVTMRLSLDPKGVIESGKFKFNEVKNEFLNYIKIRTEKGVSFDITNPVLKKWFDFSKLSIVDLKSHNPGYYELFIMVMGLNRAGFLQESRDLIESMIKGFVVDEKKRDLDYLSECACVVSSAADYFVNTRDIDQLQKSYEQIKKLSYLLLKGSSGISLGKEAASDHFARLRLMVISYAFHLSAYMARCLGIFGDEKKYTKEFESIDKSISENLEIYSGSIAPSDEYFFVDSCIIFPFRKSYKIETNADLIMAAVNDKFSSLPMFIKSSGSDMIGSLLLVNSMIAMKNSSSCQSLLKVLEYGANRYSLPDFVNPSTGKGCYGRPSSVVSYSLILCAIRNMIFIDTPERLDILPVATEEWFETGFSFNLVNAPSRFGPISIKMVSTGNEIQFYFDSLPKFVPPDIMFNIPFKSKIMHGDDFILKKEEKGRFVINGWPSVVRFVKK